MKKKTIKELLQQAPNPNMNSRPVLKDWINDAVDVLVKINALWKIKPDEYIMGETPEGGWSYTPSSVYDDWLEDFEKIIVGAELI